MQGYVFLYFKSMLYSLLFILSFFLQTVSQISYLPYDTFCSVALFFLKHSLLCYLHVGCYR